MGFKGFIINEPLPRCCGVCPFVSFMDERKYSGNEEVSAAFCNLLGGAVPRGLLAEMRHGEVVLGCDIYETRAYKCPLIGLYE